MRWEYNAKEAKWMSAHLQFSKGLAAIAPRDFPAYGRLFHPAYDREGRPVRWAEIARASHGEFGPKSDFIHVALVPHVPPGTTLWDGNTPDRGSLDPADATYLVEVLTRFTDPTQTIWYGLWEGLGWDHSMTYIEGCPPIYTPDPVPEQVRQGPRICSPVRKYLMYSGTLADALAWMSSKHQTPHLWWPSDHRWCVASDVDLPWSIVGGETEVITQLVHHSHLEVLAITPDDELDPVPSWFSSGISVAVAELITNGVAAVQTPRGTVEFALTASQNSLTDWPAESPDEKRTRRLLAYDESSRMRELHTSIKLALYDRLELY